ncbi:MAG: acetyl-CoA carboxylase biotin carboxyl carrier protein [Verrucomicrobiia bacterium]
MDLKDIKAIVDLMKKNSITEFELEKEDFKIRLKRGIGPGYPVSEESMPQILPAQPVYTPIVGGQTAQIQSTSPVQQQLPTSQPEAQEVEIEIKSPMIGTFYRAPSPESAPYVEVGSEVNPDTIVCIIEAMKVMNEIKAEVRGRITKVLVENGKPVEFGQPLFKVKPL